jgi:hypothetical protein
VTTTKRWRRSASRARARSVGPSPIETSATRPARSAAATASTVRWPATPTYAAPPGIEEANRPGRIVAGASLARSTAASHPVITPPRPRVASSRSSGRLGP